ncbi:LPXTG cell wall anchor domain-containing protein [Arthrobacter sp. zg-Y179]|uniref:LPXTG cell wall anchor domain-containing protein n=1 Tax=Arthrobacter sp. zg-Y179 TaxID=2894188 RepID=UPI002F42BBEA|nr:LPXTG cell wall anchor domain-containing protein [Arthrobacter sp. zg-Y179]
MTETGIYLYRKVDAKKPAAWENSGEQTFLAKQPGHQWFTDVTSLVPSVPFEVCGPGWAVQQDVLEFEGTYEWPKNLLYPDVTFPGNPKLKDSKHQELQEVMTVPDCARTPSPTPEPTDPPSEQPTLEPTDPPSEQPTPTPTDTPSQKPTPTPTPTDTPKATPSETPAGSVTPPGSNGTPPAPVTTDPGVQVAGNPSPRVPDAGLAHTGAGGIWLAAAGAAILAVGAVLVVTARRRKA